MLLSSPFTHAGKLQTPGEAGKDTTKCSQENCKNPVHVKVTKAFEGGEGTHDRLIGPQLVTKAG